MNRRDHYNIEHMRRRKEAASHWPVDRQLECAEHLMQLAIKNGRLHLFILAASWHGGLIRAAKKRAAKKVEE